MSNHNPLTAEEVGHIAASHIIVSLPNGGGYAICTAWMNAERPGDIGGVAEYAAPVFMGQRVYATLEAAQSAWRTMIKKAA
jgi:hypothetical protein